MEIEQLSEHIDVKKYLSRLGVDEGGIAIMATKAKQHILYIRNLHVGAANILKQDALSIGADLAVPRGTVIAAQKHVDCILFATQKQLALLARKELAQPFGLKDVARELKQISKIKKSKSVALMGVFNANDDSFYSSSRIGEKNILTAISTMIADGADIIDIGGVSSRPNSLSVSADDELERVRDVINCVRTHKLHEKARFSLDSYTPKVISYALDAGFSIINDITGLSDDEVCKLCASYKATAVIMHMQGTPQSMQENPIYEHILTDISGFFEERIERAESFGVEDIILDVGIGFGKTLEHNLALIKHHKHFTKFNKPLLVGASRKSMINSIVPSTIEERLAGTLAIHLEAVNNGASIIRAHDVKEHYQALKVKEAIDNF
ncbi:MAG: dihydropteroate synthase [Sulfurimonadaceae bacterium]|jgi:dihydropteroate synthase|nr:dihydropteroate synthase [Sulfurimonadaceae bacterium]